MPYRTVFNAVHCPKLLHRCFRYKNKKSTPVKDPFLSTSAHIATSAAASDSAAAAAAAFTARRMPLPMVGTFTAANSYLASSVSGAAGGLPQAHFTAPQYYMHNGWGW